MNKKINKALVMLEVLATNIVGQNNAELYNKYVPSLDVAIKALKEKRDRSNPVSLTLKELKSMVGQAVYITPLNDWVKVTEKGLMYFGYTWQLTEWHDCDEHYGDLFVAYKEKPYGGQ